MYTPARFALATLTSCLFAFAGCDSGPEAIDVEKPDDVSADAYDRLCRDQGLPDDCDICSVRNWYGDGECDDFCSSPDPDCGEPADPGCSYDNPSRVGDSAADLGEYVTGSTRYDMDDLGAIPVIDSRQIFTACVHLDFVETNQDFDVVFETVDDGEFTVNEVMYQGSEYDWVKFYAGDTQVGVIFNVNTLEIVGEVSDGDILGCGTVEPPDDDEVTCDWDTPTPFGESSEELDEMRVDVVSINFEDAEELTEIQSRQIFAAALHLEMITDDEDFDVVFEVADEGYFNLATVDADGTLYDWIQFYAGDTEVGVVFERGTTTVVAEIGDGDILGCVPADEPVDPPEDEEVTCDWDNATPFGETSSSLDEMVVGTHSFNWEDADTLSELERRQIYSAGVHLQSLDGDEDWDMVFEIADEGYFNVMSVDADGTLYDWVQFYAGDTEVGVVFADGTTNVVAEIGDGDILGCVPVAD